MARCRSGWKPHHENKGHDCYVMERPPAAIAAMTKTKTQNTADVSYSDGNLEFWEVDP